MDNIKTILCKSALHKLKRKFPYGWDLNIYRGCSHNCVYCFAHYSHKYLDETDFTKVFAKINIAEKLEKELQKPSWKREVVNIGGVTDSYQSSEADLQLMPQILKVLIKHKTPCIISTKSNLILRDFDLIAELAKMTYVNVAATIITMDDKLREKLEPNTASSLERFEILKEFRKTNASVGLHTMPIIPTLTDSYENIEALCLGAQKANVHYMLCGVCHLRGPTRTHFFDFIRQNFPKKYEKLKIIYKRGGANVAYKQRLYSKVVNPLRTKYGVSSSYSKPMKTKLKN